MSSSPYGDLPARRPRRGLRPLAAAVEQLRDGAAPPTLLAAVQRCWQQVAGRQLAAAATPVAEHHGEVTFACESAVWAAELELMSRELLERLDGALPEGPKVTDLRFITRTN